MSESPAVILALCVGFMLTIVAYGTFSLLATVAMFLTYMAAVSVLWLYSPYTHEYTAFSTGPKIVKEQDWGFSNKK